MSDQLQFDLIDLAEINLPMLDEPELPVTGLYTHPKTKQWSQLIQSYDGFAFVFGQYNWGYPAVIKNAIDYLAKEWANKPVSLVTFGGHGGSQAQIAMRLVVGSLKMKVMTTNLQLALLPSDSLATVTQKLHSYDEDAALLRAEFNRRLK